MSIQRCIMRAVGLGSCAAIFSFVAVGQDAAAAISMGVVANTNAPKYAQGEVLVKFKAPPAGANALSASTMLSQTTLGAISTKKYTLLDTTLVTSATQNTAELVSKLKTNPHIEVVVPNYISTLHATNDPDYSKLWGIENIGQTVNSVTGTPDADMDVKEAWTIEQGDASVVVAVLDTGVDYTHPDLAANMWNGLANHGYDFAGDANGNNDDDPMPSHWHGTHVAGTIGAVSNNAQGISGVAQHVSIMALKVFRPNNYAYDSDILEALEFVLQKVNEGENIVAINASYGGPSYNPIILDAINRLGAKGVLFCASAANSNADIDTRPSYPAAYDADNIISIAATDQHDKLAWFSNYGSVGVDVAAPGVNVYSTMPNGAYGFANGTSMAAPHVVGSIALLASHMPDTSVAQRKRIILAYADVKDGLIGKMRSSGRVNIFNALGHDINLLTPIDDAFATHYETAVAMDILANDISANIESLAISSVTTPANGSVVIESNGTLTYTPDAGFSGIDSFIYTVTDGSDSKSATVTISVKTESIDIPDPRLAECIRAVLRVEDVLDITQELALTITRLSCANVTDLTGIEYLANLEYINISNTHTQYSLTSLFAIRGLSKLTQAHFLIKNLSDISAVANLVNLERLEIGMGDFSDISALSTLTKLTQLSIANTKLKDISVLSSLPRLTSVNLDYNFIDDISPLSTLANLKNIALSFNNISDISALSHLNRVWSIGLAGNNVVDVSPLANLRVDGSLLFRGNKICDFTPLDHISPSDISGKNKQDRAACYGSVTTYENGSDGNTAGWRVYDNTPSGAKVLNIYDRHKESRVIELYDTQYQSRQNGYILGAHSGANAWNNRTERIIEWDMQYSENYTVFISLKTTKGHRYLYYTASSYDSGLRSGSKYIHHGLGPISKNGTWQRFTRDLDADLAEFEPDNSIISINAFLIRGSGKVDNIKLKQNHFALYEDPDNYAANALLYNTNGWRVYDNDPVGATVTNKHDSQMGRAIVLSGSSRANGYIFGDPNPANANAWNNQTDRTIHWKMNFNEIYTVYISAQTTKGHRYLYYDSRDSDLGLNSSGRYIHHGLGVTSKDGTWQTFTRDLDADLAEFEPDNSIISVNAFLVRGSGRINKIWMTE